jgi:hypothetical protein
MRRASRAFASLFDKGRGLMVPRGNGGQVRVLTLVAMCIYFVLFWGCVCVLPRWLRPIAFPSYAP